MARTVFLDTSFIIALENRDDPYHQLAKQLDGQLLKDGAVLLLHDGILMEIGDGYARLGRRAKGIALLERMIREQGYRIATISAALREQAIALYLGRSDKEWGLTDCVSFVLLAQEGVQEALSADVHFQQAGFQALLLEDENLGGNNAAIPHPRH